MVKLLVIVAIALFPLAISAGFENFILENERKLEEKFLSKYELFEEKFSDRQDETGQAISIKDFIRPEETAELISNLNLGNLIPEQKIETIFSFVRTNFQFVPDEEGEDYWQYPGETIGRGKGDCEDLTFLLVSMLIRADIPENLIWVNLKNWHSYATVHLGGKMMVLETNPDPNHFYLYDLPQFRWNRQVIEGRKRKEK